MSRYLDLRGFKNNIFFLLVCVLNHFYLRTCPQFWAAYVPCESQHLNAVQLTLEQIDLIKRLIDKYEQHLQFASSAKGNISIGPKPISLMYVIVSLKAQILSAHF